MSVSSNSESVRHPSKLRGRTWAALGLVALVTVVALLKMNRLLSATKSALDLQKVEIAALEQQIAGEQLINEAVIQRWQRAFLEAEHLALAALHGGHGVRGTVVWSDINQTGLLAISEEVSSLNLVLQNPDDSAKPHPVTATRRQDSELFFLSASPAAFRPVKIELTLILSASPAESVVLAGALQR